jgi:regulator of extracellular matrix RemA (YlzA/DUF370 family)
LVVAPSDARGLTPPPDLEGFLDGLDARMASHFEGESLRLRRPELPWPEEHVGSPFVLSGPPPGTFIDRDARPPTGPPLEALVATAARGEATPLSVALHVAGDARGVDIDRVELTLPGAEVNSWRVRHLLERVTFDGGVYRVAPRLLAPLDDAAMRERVAAGETRQWVFDVRPNAGDEPSALEGSFDLTYDGGRRMSVPVRVHVPRRPLVSLASTGLQVGWLGHTPGMSPAVYPEVEARRRALTLDALDGRDIGTVICPDAEVKLFVTASPETRAQRRALELRGRGENVNFADVLADIRRRDERDSGRSAAPLVAAPDSILLDTTEMDVETAVQAAIAAASAN